MNLLKFRLYHVSVDTVASIRKGEVFKNLWFMNWNVRGEVDELSSISILSLFSDFNLMFYTSRFTHIENILSYYIHVIGIAISQSFRILKLDPANI